MRNSVHALLLLAACPVAAAGCGGGEAAEAALANAVVEHERARNLFDRGAVARQRLDAAETARRAAAAQRDLATADRRDGGDARHLRDVAHADLAVHLLEGAVARVRAWREAQWPAGVRLAARVTGVLIALALPGAFAGVARAFGQPHSPAAIGSSEPVIGS